jgi:hypothetical protein
LWAVRDAEGMGRVNEPVAHAKQRDSNRNDRRTESAVHSRECHSRRKNKINRIAPATGIIAAAISNANNVVPTAAAYCLGVLLKKMEVAKASDGLMSPPLAGGRGSEREIILAHAQLSDDAFKTLKTRGLPTAKKTKAKPLDCDSTGLDERYRGHCMDSACIGPDDCSGQAVIEGCEYQPRSVGNRSLPPKDWGCSRRILSNALTSPAGAWSKSKTSFAVQHARTLRMQFPITVPAAIPNVLGPTKPQTKPSWNCQRKPPSKSRITLGKLRLES